MPYDCSQHLCQLYEDDLNGAHSHSYLYMDEIEKAKELNANHKKQYFEELDKAFEAYDEFTAETFSIHVLHNSRYDTDNCILAIKFTADYLRHRNWVEDDNKKYFKKLSIEVQEDLPKDIFKVKLKLYGYKEV